MFAFGHGLSYTTFDHRDLDVAGGDTGSRGGADVPPLYLTSAPASNDYG